MDGLLKHLHVTERENHAVMVTGSEIVELGKRNHSSENRLKDTTFLYHGTGQFPGASKVNEQGLSQTRFHKGFNRKQASSIVNDVALIDRAHERDKSEKIERLTVDRHSRLKSIDLRNGYDPITGLQKTSDPPIKRPESLRTGIDVLGFEAPRRGQQLLRNSTVTRMFTPHPSGEAFTHRQHVLQKEGLVHPKVSGLLSNQRDMLRRREVPSYGVEDTFSKSAYVSLSSVASTGLPESCAPGKYTPRKQPGNPSGDPVMKATWTNGIRL